MSTIYEEFNHLLSLTRLWIMEEYGIKGFYEGERMRKSSSSENRVKKVISSEQQPKVASSLPALQVIPREEEGIQAAERTPVAIEPTSRIQDNVIKQTHSKWSLNPIETYTEADVSDVRNFMENRSNSKLESESSKLRLDARILCLHSSLTHSQIKLLQNLVKALDFSFGETCLFNVEQSNAFNELNKINSSTTLKLIIFAGMNLPAELKISSIDATGMLLVGSLPLIHLSNLSLFLEKHEAKYQLWKTVGKILSPTLQSL